MLVGTASTSSDAMARAAARAWERLGGAGVTPFLVERLKKGQVYRLHGAGHPQSNVIAKRRRTETLAREEIVYQQMRLLPLPSLRCYGLVEDPDGIESWLFLEDAGDETCGDVDRVGLMEWLGSLHVSAARAGRPPALDGRGTEHYLEHLRSGRGRILANVSAPHFQIHESDVLHRTLGLLDVLEKHWHDLASFCRPVPQTLVHGDLSTRNIRVRRDHAGLHVFAVDWETAGWGNPAPDLGALFHSSDPETFNVDAYYGAVRQSWKCSRSDIELLVVAGLLFRMIAAIDWASYSLPYPTARKPILNLQSYGRHVTTAISGLGWTR